MDIASLFAGAGGVPLTELGIAGGVVLLVLKILDKFGMPFLKAHIDRMERQTEIQHKTTEVLGELSSKIEVFTAAIGRLPCTQRDPQTRTRESDNR